MEYIDIVVERERVVCLVILILLVIGQKKKLEDFWVGATKGKKNLLPFDWIRERKKMAKEKKKEKKNGGN